MTKEPLVSILMPAYNADKFISEAIQSTIDQCYKNWELLVLDDASTDRTLEKIERFMDDRIRIFKHEKNSGYLESCNELFALAKGELITFLDADDLQTPDRIALCVNEFKQDASLDFVTSDNMRIDEVGKILTSKKVSVNYERMASDPNYEVYFACASLMMKRRALEAVDGYHPFFKTIGGEDYHLIWELSRITKGKHLPLTLYKYRRHGNQNQFRQQNPLKYFMSDILSDIRRSILERNHNPLDFDSVYNEYWIEYVRSHRSDLKLRQAVEQLRLNNSISSLSLGLQAMASRPWSLSRFKSFVWILNQIVLRPSRIR